MGLWVRSFDSNFFVCVRWAGGSPKKWAVDLGLLLLLFLFLFLLFVNDLFKNKNRNKLSIFKESTEYSLLKFK